MFCRNTTFLQNSGIALMVPFQITSQPAGLSWSSLTNMGSYISKFGQVRFFCSHLSCLSFSQLSDNESCRNKHAYPQVVAYKKQPTSRSVLYSTKTSQNSSFGSKTRKKLASPDKVSQVLVGMKSKYQLFWLFCNVHVRTSHPGAHSLSCRRLMLRTMNWKAQVQKWSEKQFPRIQNGKKHWFHSHYFTVSSSGLGGFLIYSQ